MSSLLSTILKKVSLFTSLAALLFSLLAGWSVTTVKAAGPDGNVDPSFGMVEGANNTVTAVAVQNDGKVLIGGYFTVYTNSSRNYIARVNADGTLDSSFNPGSGTNAGVEDIALQNDGKVIIVGDFTAYNGVTLGRIARLNSDGTLDAGFNSATGANGAVQQVMLQSDGKLLIAGDFTSYAGVSRVHFARLNADGTLDTTFDANLDSKISILAIRVQTDGKIVVGGNNFATDYERVYLARLNPNGSPDSSFTHNVTGIHISALLIQPDGKIIIGGDFKIDGVVSNDRVARLNADGTHDATFAHLVTDGLVIVTSMALQNDGKILVATFYRGRSQSGHLYQLNPDGTSNASFSFGHRGKIHDVITQTDGKILVGGAFKDYADNVRDYLVRLNTDSSYDTSFLAIKYGTDGTINELAVQPDGKIIVAGNFTRYKGVDRAKIARLNSDGSVDVSFDPGSTFTYTVDAIALQADGKILVATNTYQEFKSGPTIYSYQLSRLNPNGTLDNSFETRILGAPYGQIYALAVQNDGKILVGGAFFQHQLGSERFSLARLNPDGLMDSSFNAAIGYRGDVYAITIQNDGKILVGGKFWLVSDTNRNGIVRLNNDGSRDNDFNPGAGTDERVNAIGVQSDGKILLGGQFTTFDGFSRKGIARLESNGWLDKSFNPGIGIGIPPDAETGSVNTLLVQPDNKIVIGGSFTTYNATTVNNIARLNRDGSPDTTFNTGIGADNVVTSLALQSNAAILVGGLFDTMDTYRRDSLVRLENRQPSSVTLVSNPNPSAQGENVTFTATLTPPNATGTVQFNFSGVVVTGNVSNGIATYVTSTLPGGSTYVSAAYSGDNTFGSSTSLTYTHLVSIPCSNGVNPLIVTSSSDDGQAAICGSFSYALHNASIGTTITFALNNDNTITFSGMLIDTLKAGVNIDGGAGVILDGNGVAGDGLRLVGSNILHNLTIRNFSGRELVSLSGGAGNRFYRIQVEA